MTTVATTNLDNDKKKLPDYVTARKTQRYPKKTLFGSVLETMTDEELAKLAEMDSPEVQKSANEYWKPKLRERPSLPLPLNVKQFVRNRYQSEIHQHQQELQEYKARLKVRDQRMNLLDRDSKYVFDLSKHPLDQLAKPEELVLPDRPRWMNKEDLEHSETINPHFLKPGVKNFNRDKHGNKPDVHTYTFIGDVMRPKADVHFYGKYFDENKLPRQQRKIVPDNRMVMTPRTLQRRQAMRSLPPSVETINGCEIPKNLKHEFGSDVCEQLLRRSDQVMNTAREISNKDTMKYKPRPSGPEEAPRPPKSAIKTPYEQIGGALRANVMGLSLSRDNHTSRQKLDYTPYAFEHREPQTDKYRCQKDFVSKWSEANVLEMRMKKALDEHFEQTLRKKKTEDD